MSYYEYCIGDLVIPTRPNSRAERRALPGWYEAMDKFNEEVCVVSGSLCIDNNKYYLCYIQGKPDEKFYFSAAWLTPVIKEFNFSQNKQHKDLSLLLKRGDVCKQNSKPET